MRSDSWHEMCLYPSEADADVEKEAALNGVVRCSEITVRLGSRQPWAVYRAGGCRASAGHPHDATDSIRRRL